MIDIVIPKDNEEYFLKIAEKLGYNEICFLYPLKNFREKNIVARELLNEKSSGKTDRPKLKISIGILLDAEKKKGFTIGDELRKEAMIIAVNGFSRGRFEKKGVDVVFGLEKQKSDFNSSRNSGLNEALCTLANKNDIAIGFSISNILESEGVERTKIIGRMMQNIRLCRKYGLNMIVASFASEPMLMRSPHDLKSFTIILGMEPGEAKKAVEKSLVFENSPDF